MKYIAILLPILLFASHSSYSQITINRTNAPLQEIFDEITAQSKLSVLYDKEQLKGTNRININVVNASVKTTLDICVSQQPFQYEISATNIRIEFNPGKLLPASPPRFTVTGTVTDGSGNPLPGSSVSIKGIKGMGVTVNKNGEFTLNDVEPISTLEISHVGYESRTLKLNNQRTLDVALNLQVKSLEEVVTNGYTTTIRRNEVGSIKKIVFDDIPKQVGNNLFSALQGRVTGMVVTQQSGLPGSPYRVQLRGQRSIGISPQGQLPNNAPLFVVDGVPFLSSAESIAQKGGILSNNPFSTINPDDIESITILKDANATSLYGSLGANGVVLITTRKAKAGSASLTANMSTGLSYITRAPDFMNTEEYLAMRNEAFKNDNEIPDINNAFDLVSWDHNRYNDWKDLLIGGSAHVTDGHLRFSGGSPYTQFAISGGYNKETTVFPTDKGKSFTSASFNFNHKTPNQKLDFGISASYGYDKNKLFGVDPTPFISDAPNAPNPYTREGKLNWGDTTEYPFSNPFGFLYQPYNTIMERLTTGLRLEYKPIYKLSLRLSGGYNLITSDEVYQIPIASQNPKFNPVGSASFGTSKSRNWIIEPQAEFRDTTRKGILKILIGSSLRSRTGISELLNGTNYRDDAGLNSINNAGTITGINDNNLYRVISAYTLVNYIFDEKYILEGTARRDGSSRFGPNKKFGNFASLGAGWIFSKEKWMENVIPALSFGKLRFTIGTSGNDQIGDYQFLDAWNNNPRNPYQNSTIIPSKLANEDYRWEIQRSFDIGLELQFFRNRLMISGTFNQGRTGDQLASITLPVQTGFNKIIRNYPAVTQNRNFELELNTINIQNKSWKWNTSFNISFLQNKLLKFPNILNSEYGNNRFVIGKSLNIIWGYKTAGFDRNTGVYQILDKDGKTIPIPTSLPLISDQTVIGTTDPKYFGGMENTIAWNNLQLQFLFQFVKQKGQDPIYSTDNIPGYIINQQKSLLNRWVSPGNDAAYPMYTQSANSVAAITWTYTNTSDLALSDASFIRLKNISLSYTLPAGWMKKLDIKKCSIFLLGQNVITLTRYLGYDPEIWLSKFSLPPLKTFAAGIQVTF